MEFVEVAILIVMGFFGVPLTLFSLKLTGITSKKKAIKKESDPEKEVLARTIKTLQENHGMIEAEMKKKINSLQGVINRSSMMKNQSLEDEEEEETVNMDDYVFDKEMVRPMLSNWGMNADALENPMLQNLILEKVKGNEELLITLGILRPRNQNQSQMDGVKPPQSAAEIAISQIPPQNWA
jgi:hypothetical protein